MLKIKSAASRKSAGKKHAPGAKPMPMKGCK